jgi:RimJ/RimL family protein N-acetyltransferase
VLTERLDLIAATIDLCDAESAGRDVLARALGVRVPTSWPPPVLEPDDVARIRNCLQTDRNGIWTLYYLVQRSAHKDHVPELVGVAGYAGAPQAGGVEIGYAVAHEHQRRGYATEAVAALVARAFHEPDVALVFATTYAALLPSIRVLEKTGFKRVPRDFAGGLLRYECRRAS